MPSFSRIQLEDWLKTIKVDCDCVLDVGGSQLPINKRLNSFNCDDYNILDLDVPHECKRYPNIIADINKFQMPPSYEYERFNIVFCIEVFEYIYNPYEAFLNLNKYLEKGGILYLSYHSFYPLHKPTGKDYLRYTYYGIEKLLQETGFKIIEHKLRDVKNDDIYLKFLKANFKIDNAEDINRLLSSGGMIKAIKI